MGPTQRNLVCWNRSDLRFVNQSGGSSGPSQRISSRFLWAHQITAPPISRTRTVDSPLLHKLLCVWTIIPLHYVLWRRTFWGAENYVLFYTCEPWTVVGTGRWFDFSRSENVTRSLSTVTGNGQWLKILDFWNLLGWSRKFYN